MEKGWDGGGAAALKLLLHRIKSVIDCYLLSELNPNHYQSPLVQGDSRFSVDIGSGEDLFDILMNISLFE